MKLLDDCVKEAIVKIFKFRDNDTVDAIRQYCDLPYVGVLIENRRCQFINKLLDIKQLESLFQCAF